MAELRQVILIGPHGAGKSTLGRALAARLGWRYDDEIGERLRREALARDPDAHAGRPQETFDEVVLRAELERDEEALRRDVPRVVETWHPGNLAYAQARSTAIAARMEPRLMGYFYPPNRTSPAQQASSRPLGGLFLVSKPGLLLVSASALG